MGLDVPIKDGVLVNRMGCLYMGCCASILDGVLVKGMVCCIW